MNSSIHIICRVCKSNNTKLEFQANNYESKSDELFDYFYCNDCKSISLRNIPNNIIDYYSNNYNPFQSNPELDLKDKENIKLIKKFKYHNSILEIGVGNGNFLIQLNSLNYKCYCIEPYSEITTKLKKNNINVVEQKLEDIDLSNLNFKVDIIYAWHSIEHLRNLEIFINICDKLLNKNGIVILSTPNKNALSYLFYKKYWYHLEAPLHTYLINPKQLLKKFKDRNYNKERSVINYSSIIMSKYGWETSGYYKKKSLGKNYHSYLGKILSYFMPYIEFLLNKTAQITLILKK